MTSDKKEEVQRRIIRAMSAFGVNHSIPYQSMSIIGFKGFLRDLSWDEVILELKSMEGVVFDFDAHEIRIPTNYFPLL